MMHPTCFRLFILALALLAGACKAIQPVAPSTASPVQVESIPAFPSFLPTACLYRISPDAGVRCGFLLVPEDRSRPDSRTIRLHVLIFKSTGTDPQPDPLILLNGGPGSPSQPMVESMLYDLIGEVWRAERDVIYLDQRGTGFSLPSLYCPEAVIDETTLAALDYEASVAADTAGMQRCYDRLRGEGINLAAYTVAESAADINDLRLVLGYESVNLYGFSYGSLLALTVMHDYPAGIRSVVLDAVLPQGVDVVHEKPGCLQSGLTALFAGCADDPVCQAAYPELETHFYAVLDRLHASPATVALMVADEEHLVVLDDLKFLHYLLGELQTSAIGQLPAQIEAAFDGTYATPAWHWLNYASGQATPASRLTGAAAYGMYYSTMCNYAAGLDRYGAQGAPICELCPEEEILHPSIATYASFMLAPCTFWDAGAASAHVTVPLSSSPIPTLLLSGAYDCALPSYLSQGLAETLGNSYHFVLSVGHAVALSPCGLYLTEQFLTNPTTQPDAACIDAMQIDWSVR